MGKSRDGCYKKLHASYEVMKELLNNASFVKAAKDSTNPNSFRRNVNTLLDVANHYQEYRLSLSSTNGRTYFDSAFPVSNHNGTNVKDVSGNNIDVSGGIEVQYANLVAYNIVCEGSKSRIGKPGVGSDARWDETVKAIQYFVAQTIRKECEPNAFVLRVSKKPLLLITGNSVGGGGIPIKADDFAIIDGQPFIIVGANVFPIKPENIAVVGDQRFALLDGQTFLLPTSS